MIVPPLPYSPLSAGELSSARQTRRPALAPYTTAREGEAPTLGDLVLEPDTQRTGLRLGYAHEVEGDRDEHSVLWMRYTHTVQDRRGMPVGTPRPPTVHPTRQRRAMRNLLCQFCIRPAHTPHGLIFLMDPSDVTPDPTKVLVSQPPVCAQHVAAAALLHPDRDSAKAYLALSTCLYGVHGHLYDHGDDHLPVPAGRSTDPLPYGHPRLSTCLAVTLVRQLKTFSLIPVDELRDPAVLSAT